MPKEPMKNRVIRVTDRTWDAAKARADERGESVSDVVRKFLTRYGIKPGSTGYVVVPTNPGTDPETTRTEASIAAGRAGGILTGSPQVYEPGQYEVDGYETVFDDLQIVRWTMTKQVER